MRGNRTRSCRQHAPNRWSLSYLQPRRTQPPDGQVHGLNLTETRPGSGTTSYPSSTPTELWGEFASPLTPWLTYVQLYLGSTWTCHIDPPSYHLRGNGLQGDFSPNSYWPCKYKLACRIPTWVSVYFIFERQFQQCMSGSYQNLKLSAQNARVQNLMLQVKAWLKSSPPFSVCRLGWFTTEKYSKDLLIQESLYQVSHIEAQYYSGTTTYSSTQNQHSRSYFTFTGHLLA